MADIQSADKPIRPMVCQSAAYVAKIINIMADELFNPSELRQRIVRVRERLDALGGYL